MHGNVGYSHAPQRRHWPAGVKLALTLCVVFFVTLLPRGVPGVAWWLAGPAVLLVIAVMVSGVPVWGRAGMVRRVLMLEPFVAGVALLAFFSPGGGWGLFGFLMARCTLAMLAMILFTATTPFSEMLRLFRKLRVPLLLVTTLALMHRYLFVLSDEAARMRRARQCRTFTSRRTLQWRTLSTVIGQLFLRASERADRIYDAMCARGWGEGNTTGAKPSGQPARRSP